MADITQFKALTGADDATAKYYLNKTNPRNLQVAVNFFFDAGGKKYDPSVEMLAKINERIETLEKDLMPVLKDTIDPPEEDPSDKKPPPKCPFCWDTTIKNGCTKPEVYAVKGDVVKKAQKPSYIYNIEAGPPLSGVDFSFGIVIDSVDAKRDPYDTIGIKDASDVHLRCSPTGGACVQIQTGQLYVKGQLKPQKFSRLPQLGDCIKISYSASTHAVSFTLLNASGQADSKVITTTFTPANGGVRPAVAARQIGWGFRLVAGDGSRVVLPPDVLIKQVWSAKGTGALDVTAAVLKESSEIESDSVKAACLKLQSLHKQCVELVNRGLADTGGVMGDVLREHLSALAALKDELEQETKKVMDLVGDDTNGDDVTDNVARRVNCDLWLNTQNGLVQDCEKNVKNARDALKELDGDGEESSKTSSSSLTPKGIALLKKLRSDLDATLQYVDSTTKRMKVLVTKIAAKVPQPETIQYTAPASAKSIDWSNICQWIVLKKGEYDPKQTDSVTLEEFGEGPVVRMPCSTKGFDCVFLQSTIERTLASSGTCPSCKQRYETFGEQPSGTMRINPQTSTHLSGYAGKGSWVISYSFPSGTQTDRNIRPGMRYQGTTRTCYLPLTDEGDEALELLKSAFRCGKLFRVGDSITTGSQNQTVWAGIHQKTAVSGGAVGHGWPDPEYFNRLRNECAACGVFTKEFLDKAKKDREKWKLDRQKSAENKAKEDKEEDEEEKMDVDDTKPAIVDEKAIAEIESKLAKVQKDLQNAMRSGNRKKIMELMKLRQKLTAEKIALRVAN